MEPGFLDHAKQAEMVGEFAAATTAIVATMDVENILHGGGQGP